MINLSVLVADDNPIIRKIYQKRLQETNHDVTIVNDGLQAIHEIEKRHFDVVLTDLVMPGVDGLGLLQSIKDKDPSTEVIVITGKSSIDTAVKAIKKGAIDYLEKPINFDELFLRLNKIEEMKSIIKNAEDLRDAMEFTESSAAQTIQQLEESLIKAQQKQSSINSLAKDNSLSDSEKIVQIINIISNTGS